MERLAIMIDRKHKRVSENICELHPRSTSLLLTPALIEVGSGYTVAVSYDEDEKQIVDVKTYGEIDLEKLRKEIRRIFPNAKIRRLGSTAPKTKKKKKGK